MACNEAVLKQEGKQPGVVAGQVRPAVFWLSADGVEWLESS